jgi:intracellular multiplication protein IcmL
MAVSGLRQVLLRNDFYRDNFRRMVFVAMLSFILNIILVIALLYHQNQTAQPVYFATTPDGKLIKLEPLQSPILNDEAVISWVGRAVPEVYSLDFMSYKEKVLQSKKYFTSYGWPQFLKAFDSTLTQIRDEKLVTRATLIGVPIITAHKIIDGRYTWYVQVPIMITFQKGSLSSSKQIVWSLVVQRMNDTTAEGGLQPVGISQVVQNDLPPNQ